MLNQDRRRRRHDHHVNSIEDTHVSLWGFTYTHTHPNVFPQSYHKH